jgi:hypothetical protein
MLQRGFLTLTLCHLPWLVLPPVELMELLLNALFLLQIFQGCSSRRGRCSTWGSGVWAGLRSFLGAFVDGIKPCAPCPEQAGTRATATDFEHQSLDALCVIYRIQPASKAVV